MQLKMVEVILVGHFKMFTKTANFQLISTKGHLGEQYENHLKIVQKLVLKLNELLPVLNYAYN